MSEPMLTGFIDGIIAAAIIASSQMKSLSGLARRILIDYSPFVKNPAFSEEREWRLTTVAAGSSSLDLKFRRGAFTIVPYLETDLRSNSPSFIKEIIVGPGPNAKLDFAAVQTLVHSRKLGIAVRQSEVPYRNW
jgi:hypothetical protein